jgi:uncharacterized integral membrane protein
MITLIIVIIAVSVMVLFSVQNAAPVVVSFFAWKFGASLAVIIVLSVLIGILIGGATASFLRIRRSIKNKKTMAPESLESKQQTR